MTRRKTGPTKAVADIVKARAQGACEHCGELPGEQIHHRLPRRMGGTRRTWINEPSNLLNLNAKCHDWAERAGRAEALKRGLILSDNADPASHPVRLWHGLVRLDDVGGWTRLGSDMHTAGCAVWTSDDPCDCTEEE